MTRLILHPKFSGLITLEQLIVSRLLLGITGGKLLLISQLLVLIGIGTMMDHIGESKLTGKEQDLAMTANG